MARSTGRPPLSLDDSILVSATYCAHSIVPTKPGWVWLTLHPTALTAAVPPACSCVIDWLVGWGTVILQTQGSR